MLVLLLILSAITLVASFALVARITDVRRHSVLLVSILTGSLFFPLSTVFLIPVDILNTDTGNKVVLSRIWRANYWISFLLTLLVLPFYQYYLGSGEFNVIRRVKKSAYQVVLVLAACVVIAILSLIYFHNFANLSATIVSVSQITSLLFAIICLVHGLISIPKSFIPRSYDTKLTKAYKQLPQLEYELRDTQIDRDDVYLKIKALHSVIDQSSDFRDEIIYLNDQVPATFKVPRQQLLQDYLDTSISVTQLHENVKFYNWKYLHAETKFQNKLLETLYYEDVISQLSEEPDIPRPWRTSHWKFPNFYYKYVVPLIESLGFIATAVIGIIIIQSETFHSTKLSIISLPRHTISVLPAFLYMMAASIHSLSQISVFSIYQVSNASNSDPVSTIFFVGYTIRLSVPISYNFLTLLNAKGDDIAFLKWMQASLSKVPLASFLNSLIPSLSVLFAAFVGLGSVSKIGKWVDEWLGGMWTGAEGEGDELVGRGIAVRWESYGLNNAAGIRL